MSLSHLGEDGSLEFLHGFSVELTFAGAVGADTELRASLGRNSGLFRLPAALCVAL